MKGDGIQEIESKILFRNNICPLKKITQKLLYSTLITTVSEHPVTTDKWIEEFPFLGEKQFEEFFTLPYHITLDSTSCIPV